MMIFRFVVVACMATVLWPTTSYAQAMRDLPAPFNCAQIQGKMSKYFYERNTPILNSPDHTALGEPSSPAKVGINSLLLEQAAEQLESFDRSKVWSFLVARNDRLVFERYFHRRSNKYTSNNVHSAAKSILGAAVGVAIDQGLLDLNTKIADLLPHFGGFKNGITYTEIKDEKKRLITVRHLLTMSSGIQWIEDDTEYTIQKSADRIRAILELPFAMNPATNRPAEPGELFTYSTGNSHLLSAVLEEALLRAANQRKISKQTVCQFVHENILAKIGVVAERWGRDAQGYFSGGFNLYLTPRELVKFGMLYLNDGKSQGQQIISKQWVDSSIAPNLISVRAQDSELPDGYGYYFWLSSDIWRGGSAQAGALPVAMAWGHGGQMVYIVKSMGLVIVITRDTRANFWNALTGRSEKAIAKQLETIIKDKVIPAAVRQ